MPSFHKAWARQETAGMTDKFRDTLKPQGALKPRIQNAVNKLQAQTSLKHCLNFHLLIN